MDETAKEEKLKFGQKNAVKRCLVLTVFEPHVHNLIPDGTFPPDVFHASIWGGAHRKSLFRGGPLKEVLKRLDEPSVCRIKSRPIRFFLLPVGPVSNSSRLHVGASAETMLRCV